MKIEHSPYIFQPVSVSSSVLPQRPSFSTESTLVSPYAPTFPRLARFFNWLWNYLRSFFQAPEKPKAAPTPSPATLQAIRNAEKEGSSWLDPTTIGIGIAGVGFCYWQWERVYPFAVSIPGKILAIPGLIWSTVPSMIAIQTNTVLTSKIEQKGRAYLPAVTPAWMIKGASLTAASAAVWYTTQYLGYPMGQAYLGFLSRLTFQGLPAFAVPLATSQLTSYFPAEKIFWGILAFNVARYAHSSLSPTTQTHTHKSSQT